MFQHLKILFLFIIIIIIIAGSSGSGKTTLIKCLIEKVRGPPNFLFTAYIDCYHLKGNFIQVNIKLFTFTSFIF